MKKAFVLLAVSMIMAPLAYAKSPANDFKGITVMSFNIRNSNAKDGTNSWELRAEAVLEMIKDQTPDVLGLQEATDLQNHVLDYFLDDYKFIGVGRDDGKKAGEFMSILYNKKTTSVQKWGTFWLSDTPDEPSKGWDAEYMRTATWAIMKDKKSGSKYFVINTHLDNSGQQARQEGLALILKKAAELNPDNLPTILMGDFNMEPDNPALSTVRKAMMNCRDIAAKSDDKATCHSWGKTSERLDYIWIKGFGSCLEYTTVTKHYKDRAFVSDHYPIKAKIMF